MKNRFPIFYPFTAAYTVKGRLFLRDLLVDASKADMMAEIDSRAMVEEWAVAIGWTFHWKFPEYNLRFLEDPLGIFGEEENIKALGRAGLTEEMPEVAELMGNYSQV